MEIPHGKFFYFAKTCIILLMNNVLNQWINPMKIEWKTIDIIKQWIDQSIYHHVLGEILAYKLWKRLNELFKSKNSLNKALLITKLVNLKYKDGSSMREHLKNSF